MAPNSPAQRTANGLRARSPDLELWGVILLALALRLPNLARPLWYDEVLYSARLGAPSVWGLLRFVLNEPGSLGFRVFTFFWVQLLGENPVVLRLPSLACGLVSICLTYALARLYTGRSTALLAALMLALSPVHVWYSQEATPYAVALCLLLAAVYQGSRIRAGTVERHTFSIYTVLLLAAGLTHYYSGLFLLPLSLLALQTAPRVRNRLWVSHATVALWLCLPILLRVISGTMITGMPYGRPFSALEWWMLFFNWFLHGNSLWSVPPHELYSLGGWGYLERQPPLALCQVTALAALLCGLLVRSRPESSVVAGIAPAAARTGNVPRRPWELGLYLVCSPLMLLALTVVGLDRLYIERFLYVLLPYFWILLARGVTESIASRWKPVLVGALVLWSVTAYGAMLARPDVWTVYKHNPDWPSTVSYLLDDRAATDRDLVLVAVPYADLLHHLRAQRTDGLPLIRMVSPKQVALALAEHPGGRVYLINEWFWAGDTEEVQQALATEPGLTLTKERSFRGLTVYEYVPR